MAALDYSSDDGSIDANDFSDLDLDILNNAEEIVAYNQSCILHR